LLHDSVRNGPAEIQETGICGHLAGHQFAAQAPRQHPGKAFPARSDFRSQPNLDSICDEFRAHRAGYQPSPWRRTLQYALGTVLYVISLYWARNLAKHGHLRTSASAVQPRAGRLCSGAGARLRLADLIRSVREQGLEGLVAKRRDSKYESGQRLARKLADVWIETTRLLAKSEWDIRREIDVQMRIGGPNAAPFRRLTQFYKTASTVLGGRVDDEIRMDFSQAVGTLPLNRESAMRLCRTIHYTLGG
jgi:hypothetical protein